MKKKQEKAGEVIKNQYGNNETMQPTLMQDLLHLLLKIAGVAVVLVLLFTIVFGVMRCEDTSMVPAVKDGDLAIYCRVDKNYVASDGVVVKYEGKHQVRRVVAIAGDTVDILDGHLVINGAPQLETYLYTETEQFSTGVKFPLAVQEGEIFVLADNRENATDSRIYGCVSIEDTRGKIMTIIRRRGM